MSTIEHNHQLTIATAASSIDSASGGATEETKNAVMDPHDSKQLLFETASSPTASSSHRKSFSEASEVTINVTQETEATSPLTPEGKKSHHILSLHEVEYPRHQDDEDSSNDGSYFADPMVLPSPKSDRRFSGSKRHVSRVNHDSSNRASDASLSLSDDSEDHGHHHRRRRSQDIARQHPGSDHRVDLYPQQITRIHSISSLVSGSSNRSSSSDSELDDDNDEYSDKKPSGRRSPVLGKHPPSRSGGTVIVQSPSSHHNTQPSPPTILPSYQQQHLAKPCLHPQPHTMSPEQALVAPWGSPPVVPPRVQFSFSSPSTTSASAVGTPMGSSGSKSSGLVYSEDSDTILQHSFTLVNHGSGNGAVHGQQTLPIGLNLGPQDHEQQSAYSGESNGVYINGADVRNCAKAQKRAYTSTGSDLGEPPFDDDESRHGGFQVYWQRWFMLFYMSLLNLLSDWTCYSVAPIAILTEEAFGHINPEQLVVLFLAANAVATACEPILLSRLGLRKTVLFGSLLLMIGSIIKSGGMPPVIEANLEKGRGEWRVYLGFFLVGLSQPLYQCTPALLSASWFPEKERTLATGIALNANQVGIGFAFIFGTLLVETSNDIVNYFSLLSMLSTLTFLGTLIQFDDAPPTPPSNTARVMRGTLEVNLPSLKNIFDFVRNVGTGTTIDVGLIVNEPGAGDANIALPFLATASDEVRIRISQTSLCHTESMERSESSVDITEGDAADEPACLGCDGAREPSLPSSDLSDEPAITMAEEALLSSPTNGDSSIADHPDRKDPGDDAGPNLELGESAAMSSTLKPEIGSDPPQATDYGANVYQSYSLPYPQYQPVWDAQCGHYVYYPAPVAQPTDEHLVNYPVQQYAMCGSYGCYDPSGTLASPAPVRIDQGVEPVLKLCPHHLDIEIRDDQVWLSIKACMTRPGFIHALISFAVSGIVINTLSTFMDYLVRLNGAGREYTGIVGGSFQFVIMISSLIMGQFTDKTRAYYSIIIGMLVLGAFGLAECGVNLDADKGVQLRFSLIIVAALVGPLQPISTELGVETVYPLSENTVLVIQQLFANLLSACFIPCFKAFKNFDLRPPEKADETMQPQFTFSFYVLIVLHAIATVAFATFNGRYLRLEHEEERIATERIRQAEKIRDGGYGSFEECDRLFEEEIVVGGYDEVRQWQL